MRLHSGTHSNIMFIAIQEEDFTDKVRVGICEGVGEEFLRLCVVRLQFRFLFNVHARGISTDGNSAEVIDIHFIDLELTDTTRIYTLLAMISTKGSANLLSTATRLIMNPSLATVTGSTCNAFRF